MAKITINFNRYTSGSVPSLVYHIEATVRPYPDTEPEGATESCLVVFEGALTRVATASELDSLELLGVDEVVSINRLASTAEMTSSSLSEATNLLVSLRAEAEALNRELDDMENSVFIGEGDEVFD